MPKIVDHQKRRTEIIDAAVVVLRRDGVEGLTVRSLASEAKLSPGTIGHYFADKDEILQVVQGRADGYLLERIRQIPDELDPVERLRQALEATLPLDEDRSLESSLIVNYWARALNQPRLRAAGQAGYSAGRDRVRQLVEAAQDAQMFTDEQTAETITDVLLSFVHGLSIHAMMFPTVINHTRLARVLDAQLAAFSIPAEASH